MEVQAPVFLVAALLRDVVLGVAADRLLNAVTPQDCIPRSIYWDGIFLDPHSDLDVHF